MKKSDVHTLDRVSSLMSVDNSPRAPSFLPPPLALWCCCCCSWAPITNQTGLEKYFPADSLVSVVLCV